MSSTAHRRAPVHSPAGNIWAHLLPILAILLALYFNALRMWPKAPVAFLENLVPILLCLSGSVMYHSMMAHHWHYKKFLACDVSTCIQPWAAAWGSAF